MHCNQASRSSNFWNDKFQKIKLFKLSATIGPYELTRVAIAYEAIGKKNQDIKYDCDIFLQKAQDFCCHGAVVFIASLFPSSAFRTLVLSSSVLQVQILLSLMVEISDIGSDWICSSYIFFNQPFYQNSISSTSS